jgi:hypothetical protein
VAKKKLAIPKGTPVHLITSLFDNATGFERKVLVDWDGFFKNWTEVVEDTDFPDGLLTGVGAHVVICGHMGQHDFLKWYFTLEEPKVWDFHQLVYVPHDRDGFSPAPTSRTVAVHVTFFWPASLAKDGPSEHIQFRKNMQKFIGRSLLPTAVCATEVDILGRAGERHWHKGRTSVHQNVIKEFFGKVLMQGRVLVNLFAEGEFIFAGLVRHYFPFSIISISSSHLPFVHFGWGGLPISASDGEGSPCPPRMERAPYLGSRWGVLPIRSSDKDGS